MYEGAVLLYQRAIKTGERVLGPDHPDLASRLNNLAELLRDQASYPSTPVVCVYARVLVPFILDVRFVDVPAGVTQEEGRAGFLILLPSAVLALIFLARRIQPFISLVDREVEFCGRTNQSFSTCWAFLFFLERKNPSSCDCAAEIRTHVPAPEGFRGYHRGDRLV